MSSTTTGNLPDENAAANSQAEAPEPEPAEPAPLNRPRKRKNPRSTFPYRQYIAPIREGVLPSKRKFFAVVCRDISCGGFSFYLDRIPEFDTLVAALGRAPDITEYIARVMRIERIQGRTGVCFLVACRFVSRIGV